MLNWLAITSVLVLPPPSLASVAREKKSLSKYVAQRKYIYTYVEVGMSDDFLKMQVAKK